MSIEQESQAGLMQALMLWASQTLDGIIVTDSKGMVRWINPGLTGICGYTLEELVGRSPGTLLQGPATNPASALEMRHAVRERRSCAVELVNYHKDGTPYWVSIHLTPLPPNNGQDGGFLAVEHKIKPTDALFGTHHLCAWCKSVLTEQGDWEPLDMYVRERSSAEFSHTICPDCAVRMQRRRSLSD